MKKIIYLLFFLCFSIGCKIEAFYGSSYAGDFKPKFISGCKVWLDASNTRNFVFRGGTYYVQQWNDLSGNNKHAIQAVEAAQPIVTSNCMNGLDTVYFEGYGIYLVFANYSFPYGDSSYTYFIVIKAEDTHSTHEFIQSGTNATYKKFFLRFLSNALEHDWYGAALAGGSVAPDTCYILQADYDGTTRRSIVNNGTIYSDVPGVACQNTGENVRLSSNWDGIYYAEVIIYDRRLNSLESNQIANYLSDKWGISI